MVAEKKTMKSRPIFTARALLRALRRLSRVTIARLENIARTIVFWSRKIILQIASFARKTMSPGFPNTRSDFEYLCWFILISGFPLAIGIGIIGDILGGISESIKVGFSLMALGFLITMAILPNIWDSLILCYRWITKASNKMIRVDATKANIAIPAIRRTIPGMNTQTPRNRQITSRLDSTPSTCIPARFVSIRIKG